LPVVEMWGSRSWVATALTAHAGTRASSHAVAGTLGRSLRTRAKRATRISPYAGMKRASAGEG
jgi:hypothetical protein